MAVTRFHAELGLATGTGLLGLAGLIGALDLGVGWTQSGPDSGYFPFYISLVLIAASLWNIGAAIRTRMGGGEAALELAQAFLEGEGLRRVATFLAELTVFVVLSIVMGVYFGGTLYLAWSAWKHGGYRPVTALAIGVIFSIVQFVLFEWAFLVPLNKGPIEAMLGIY